MGSPAWRWCWARWACGWGSRGRPADRLGDYGDDVRHCLAVGEGGVHPPLRRRGPGGYCGDQTRRAAHARGAGGHPGARQVVGASAACGTPYRRSVPSCRSPRACHCHGRAASLLHHVPHLANASSTWIRLTHPARNIIVLRPMCMATCRRIPIAKTGLRRDRRMMERVRSLVR